MKRWILIVLATAYSLTPTDSPAAKPVLEVWTSATCPPCLKFWRDYESDASFRRALDLSYDVRKIDYCRNQVEGKLKLVFSLPTFLTGRGRVTGYTSADDLLARLGLQRVEQLPPRPRPRPEPRPPRPATPPADNTPPLRFENVPPTPPTPPAPDEMMAIQTELAEIKKRLEELAVNSDSPPRVIVVKGQAGPEGPPGKDGRPGAPGRDADPEVLENLQVRIEEIARRDAEASYTTDAKLAEVLKRIMLLEKFQQEHRVRVQILAPDGSLIREESFDVFGGEPIQLQLKPRQAK